MLGNTAGAYGGGTINLAPDADDTRLQVNDKLLEESNPRDLHPAGAPSPLRERRCWQTFVTGCVVAVAALSLFFVVGWQRTADTARDPVTGQFRLHTFQYFVLCFFGGVVAGTAHTAVTPIDLIKCRMQVGEYKSMGEGFHQVISVDAKGSWLRALPLLYRGWVPTLLAYCIQGAIKFSLYEWFKHAMASAWLHPHGANESGGLATLLVYVIASSLAEIVADLGLAPWEAVKIKVQTTSVFPDTLSLAVPRVWLAEGLAGFYKGLVPLWFRQVPYTIMKFASFEQIVRGLNYLFFGSVSAANMPSASAQLAVTMLAGVLAGILCALVSHPADTLVSKMNQRGKRAATTSPPVVVAVADGTGPDGGYPSAAAAAPPVTEDHRAPLSSPSTMELMMALIRELGWSGLWRGLGPRMVMVGFLTSLQWILYDSFKVAVGLPTTGSSGSASVASTHAPVAPAVQSGSGR